MIDIKLKTFLAVVQTGSFTRAAEQLCLSQPAISYHMRQLEEEYDIKLFQNSKKTLALTAEGEVLIRYAQQLFNISETAKRALSDVKHSQRHFTVGITPPLEEALVARVFAAYCNEHAHTRISVVTDSMENLYDRLAGYSLDWIVVEGSLKERRCRLELLDMDYLCLVVSPSHPFAHQASVPLCALKAERLILQMEHAGARSLLESSLIRHHENIRNFNIILEIDSIHTIKELVLQNLGVTIMAHSAVVQEEASGRLCVVAVEGMKMVREVNIVYLEDFKHTEIFPEMRRMYHLPQ